MTNLNTVDASEPSKASEASEGAQWWAVHSIGGRNIHFNAPSPEQLMVMRRLAKELGGSNVGRAIVSMGKVLDAVSACMSTDEERDFVDDLVMSRQISMDELAPLIQSALAGPHAKSLAPKNGPQRRARRRS